MKHAGKAGMRGSEGAASKSLFRQRIFLLQVGCCKPDRSGIRLAKVLVIYQLKQLSQDLT
jgi:hypothetical protein